MVRFLFQSLCPRYAKSSAETRCVMSKAKGKKQVFLLFIVVLAAAIIFLIPVAATVVQSLQTDGVLSLAGYRELLLNCFPFYQMFWNSALYAAAITVGAILISILAAFAFQFAQFRAKKLLYILYIVLMMMPLQVMVLPNYIGLRELGLLDTRAAIIVPLVFSPLGTVVLRQYMEGNDVQVVEAARLETNSCLRIMWHCVLPQLRVCIYAVALFLFAEAWNLVEQPILYVRNDDKRNLSIFFSQMDQYEGNVLYPAAVLFMLPVFLWYLMYHRELKEGLKYQ